MVFKPPPLGSKGKKVLPQKMGKTKPKPRVFLDSFWTPQTGMYGNVWCEGVKLKFNLMRWAKIQLRNASLATYSRVSTMISYRTDRSHQRCKPKSGNNHVEAHIWWIHNENWCKHSPCHIHGLPHLHCRQGWCQMPSWRLRASSYFLGQQEKRFSNRNLFENWTFL